jgi:hypothetical protein
MLEKQALMVFLKEMMHCELELQCTLMMVHEWEDGEAIRTIQ